MSRILRGANVGMLEGECFDAHENRGEDVIQIMRDSSCQRPYAFQSLYTKELLLNRSLTSVLTPRTPCDFPSESCTRVQRA